MKPRASVILIVLFTCAWALLIVLAAADKANGATPEMERVKMELVTPGERVSGPGWCHPSVARSTRVWYVETYGDNTAVELVATCNGASTVWHVSFFDGLASEGAQPSLWNWWEIQNTASKLLEER